MVCSYSLAIHPRNMSVLSVGELTTRSCCSRSGGRQSKLCQITRKMAGLRVRCCGRARVACLRPLGKAVAEREVGGKGGSCRPHFRACSCDREIKGRKRDLKRAEER